MLFSLVNGNDKSFLIRNMILIIFKLYVNKSRVSGTLDFNTFLRKLVKAKNLQRGAAFNNKQKHDMFLKKLPIV